MSGPDFPPAVRQAFLDPLSISIEESISGGLSGANLWRCRSAAGPVCLRAWPPGRPSPEQLAMIHRALSVAARAQLEFIPVLIPTPSGETSIFDGSRHWEVSQWMPGAADYLTNPNERRLLAATEALASLHTCWRGPTTAGPSPAVTARASLLADWLANPPVVAGDSGQLEELVPFLVSDTTRRLQELGPALLEELNLAAGEEVEQHWILRDIWSEHVLFISDQVSGIVDFGAIQHGDPAADLARLLGSLEPFAPTLRKRAILYYNAFTQSPIRFRRVELLDRAGTLLAALQWLQWLAIDHVEFDLPRSQLLKRWQSFLDRLANSDSAW